MIYRIVCGMAEPIYDNNDPCVRIDENGIEWCCERYPIEFHICSRGCMSTYLFPAFNYCNIPHFGRLRSPSKVNNKKARFWWTEEGWRKYGQKIAKEIQNNNLSYIVKKEKNPKKSQIIYKDEYQYALLPL